MRGDDPIPVRIIQGLPHTFGWLKIRDHFRHGIKWAEEWEDPEGARYMLEPGRTLLTKLLCDTTTKEDKDGHED